MLVVVLLMLMTMMVVVAIMVTAVVLTLVMRVWLSLLLHGSWILWVLLPVATMVSFTMVLAVALSSMIHAAIVRVRSVSMHADFLCEVVETCQIDENCVAITQLQGPHKTAPGASFWSLGVVAPNQTCKLGGVFVHCLWGLARTMLLGLFVRKLWRSEDRLLLPTSSNPGTKRPSSTSSIVGASPPT